MDLLLLKKALLLSLAFYLLLWIVSRRFFIGNRVSGTNLIIVALMPILIYLSLYIVENSSVFRAKTPFGEISFEKVAREMQMKETVLKFPTLPIEEAYLPKGAPFDRRNFLRSLIQKRPLCLTLQMGRRYSREILEQYLQTLEGFSFFKYVVFTQKDGTFIGFLPASDFHQIFSVFGSKIIWLLAQEDFALQANPVKELQQLLGLNTYRVSEDTTADQALALFEKKKLKAIAVVDKKERFKGITEAEDLLLLIVNRLVAKEKRLSERD